MGRPLKAIKSKFFGAHGAFLPLQEHPHVEMRMVPEDLRDTYRELVGRIDYHIRLTRRRCAIYHNMSRVLLWGTPLLSGILTAFISNQVFPDTQNLAFVISCLVTVMTAMNSTVRPQEIALFSEKFSNAFWKFHTVLKLEIEKVFNETISQKERSQKLNQLLGKQNVELCAMIDEFNKGPDLRTRRTQDGGRHASPVLTPRKTQGGGG